MKKILLLMLTLATFGVSAQNYEWAKSMGATGVDRGRSIAVDASGNVYTTGSYQDTIDFDPGAGVSNLTSQSPGGTNIFISKLDVNGDFVWAKSMGGTLSTNSFSIVLDASGNIYLIGSYEGTVDFDPGAGVSNLTSQGRTDIFISKLDANGDFVWAKSMGGTSYDVGFSIAVDASENVYTTGAFYNTVDFDPGAGVSNLTSQGGADVFISKLDANGNFVWAKSMGGAGSNEDFGYSIAVDAAGNVFTTGHFRNTVDFDPGTGINNLTSQGVNDVFISKLDANGNFVWAKNMGGTSYEDSFAIALDALGNVYTTGYYQAVADFDPGPGVSNLTSQGSFDVFISKLDVNGDFVWAKSMGGTNSDYSNSIALDALGNVYITGGYKGVADFDPGVGVSNLTSQSGFNIFISKLDANGNFLWAESMSGSSGNDYGNSITVDASENVYATGIFNSIVDFDPGAGVSSLTSQGGGDIFVSKLSQTSTGINETTQNLTVSLYPNPTEGKITFTTTEQISNVEIYNLKGQKVATFNNANTIDISNLSNGIYTAKIVSDNKIATKKIVKQ